MIVQETMPPHPLPPDTTIFRCNINLSIHSIHCYSRNEDFLPIICTIRPFPVGKSPPSFIPTLTLFSPDGTTASCCAVESSNQLLTSNTALDWVDTFVDVTEPPRNTLGVTVPPPPAPSSLSLIKQPVEIYARLS